MFVALISFTLSVEEIENDDYGAFQFNLYLKAPQDEEISHFNLIFQLKQSILVLLQEVKASFRVC
jgi:hypothetical protein